LFHLQYEGAPSVSDLFCCQSAKRICKCIVKEYSSIVS